MASRSTGGRSWSLGNAIAQSGSGASTRQVTEPLHTASKPSSWPVFLFLLALVVPWVISVGPLRLSLYRFVLLAMVLPCLTSWMSGKAGRIRIADIALLLFSLWS